MRNNYKNRKGFTLLEVVISIFTLSIISGFILQMFMESSRVNMKAQDLDIGQYEAISAIEVIKSKQNPFDFTRDVFFKNAVISNSEYAVTAYKYYDRHFEEIDPSSFALQSETNPEDTALADLSFVKSAGVAFILKVQLYALEQTPEEESFVTQLSKTFETGVHNAPPDIVSRCYTISASALSIESGKNVSELAKFYTKKYFVYEIM